MELLKNMNEKRILSYPIKVKEDISYIPISVSHFRFNVSLYRRMAYSLTCTFLNQRSHFE
jgi:hypothetical protein